LHRSGRILHLIIEGQSCATRVFVGRGKGCKRHHITSARTIFPHSGLSLASSAGRKCSFGGRALAMPCLPYHARSYLVGHKIGKSLTFILRPRLIIPSGEAQRAGKAVVFLKGAPCTHRRGNDELKTARFQSVELTGRPHADSEATSYPTFAYCLRDLDLVRMCSSFDMSLGIEFPA
jgi:hypothetical protein